MSFFSIRSFTTFFLRSTTDPKQFIIRHFAGEVCYDSENFIDKNRNFLSPDLIATMRDSTDEIVRLIFCIPFGSNGRLMQQQESSTTSSSSNKSDNQQYSQSRSQQTVSTYFRYSLMNLLRTTLDGTPHFVRCIKPNVLQKPDKLSVDQLVRQLRYSGLLETVRARASGFTHRLTFADFLRRYCFLGFSFDERVVATKENCQLLLLRYLSPAYSVLVWKCKQLKQILRMTLKQRYVKWERTILFHDQVGGHCKLLMVIEENGQWPNTYSEHFNLIDATTTYLEPVKVWLLFKIYYNSYKCKVDSWNSASCSQFHHHFTGSFCQKKSKA